MEEKQTRFYSRYLQSINNETNESEIIYADIKMKDWLVKQNALFDP